jgi:hypothetical protein
MEAALCASMQHVLIHCGWYSKQFVVLALFPVGVLHCKWSSSYSLCHVYMLIASFANAATILIMPTITRAIFRRITRTLALFIGKAWQDDELNARLERIQMGVYLALALQLNNLKPTMINVTLSNSTSPSKYVFAPRHPPFVKVKFTAESLVG